MKIHELELFLIESDRCDGPDRPRSLLVRMRTASGLEGWGESAFVWRPDELAARRDSLLAALSGRSVFDIEELHSLDALWPPPIRAAVEMAAWFHDVGKVDPRFQIWLHCSDEIAAAFRLLAKSRINPRNRHLYEAARKTSGLPAGWRHELLSVQLAETVCDDALVLHLIAAHHGGGRPFVTPVLDLDPPEIPKIEHAKASLGLAAAERTPEKAAELCDRIADRFASLQRRYGWWGLALLESLLLLADWRQSADERTVIERTEQAQP